MSENRSVISYVGVTNTDVKCPGCGTSIGVRFDPVSATLTCPFCGLSSKLPAPQDGAVAQELDFNSALQRASVDWGSYKKIRVCSNCGGQTIYDAEQVTGACPFCGSTSVAPAPETSQIMAPNSVIPFAFSKEQAQTYFLNFVKKKRLVKKKVFDCKLENVIGIYLPYWTFDAFTASTYYGFYYDSGTTPYDLVTGALYQNFDDVLISASNMIRHPFISKVMDYDFTKAVPFSAAYLAGIPAVRYTLGLNEGWERTKKHIAEKLKKDVNRSNVLQISIDDHDILSCEGKTVSPDELRQQVESFLASRQTDNYAIAVETGRHTSYNAYFNMQHSIVAAYHKLGIKPMKIKEGIRREE